MEDKKRKRVDILLAVEVDEEVAPETVAETVASAIGPLAEKVHNVSDVAVRTVPRDLGRLPSGSYDTRIWERVTCDLTVEDPGARLVNPIPEEDRILDRALRLTKEAKELGEEITTLIKKTRGS